MQEQSRPCACGCGQVIAPTRDAPNKRFVHGHQSRKPRLEFDQPTHCECGCGVPLDLTWHRKRSRRGVHFLRGHQLRVIKPVRRRDLFKGQTYEQRFWAKVDKNGPVVRPELGPCWIWTGNRDPWGLRSL